MCMNCPQWSKQSSRLVLHSFQRTHVPELMVGAEFLLNVNCMFSLAYNFTPASTVVSCDVSTALKKVVYYLRATGLAMSLSRLARHPTLNPCPVIHPIQTNKGSLSTPVFLSFNKQMLIEHLLYAARYCDELKIQQLLAQ